MSYCVPWFSVGKRNKMITVAAMVMLIIRRRKNKKVDADQLGRGSTMDFLLQTQVLFLPHNPLICFTFEKNYYFVL